MMVVFDLDGTLADTRQAAVNNLYCPVEGFPIERDVKDWSGFNRECEFAPQLSHGMEVLHALYDAGHDVRIWTARGDEAREQTKNWLLQNGVPPEVIETLVMRDAGDLRDSVEVKREFLARDGKPDLIFEDHKGVVEMWRSLGLNVYQVAVGDFG